MWCTCRVPWTPPRTPPTRAWRRGSHPTVRVCSPFSGPPFLICDRRTRPPSQGLGEGGAKQATERADCWERHAGRTPPGSPLLWLLVPPQWMTDTDAITRDTRACVTRSATCWGPRRKRAGIRPVTQQKGPPRTGQGYPRSCRTAPACQARRPPRGPTAASASEGALTVTQRALVGLSWESWECSTSEAGRTPAFLRKKPTNGTAARSPPLRPAHGPPRICGRGVRESVGQGTRLPGRLPGQQGGVLAGARRAPEGPGLGEGCAEEAVLPLGLTEPVRGLLVAGRA